MHSFCTASLWRNLHEWACLVTLSMAFISSHHTTVSQTIMSTPPTPLPPPPAITSVTLILSLPASATAPGPCSDISALLSTMVDFYLIGSSPLTCSQLPHQLTLTATIPQTSVPQANFFLQLNLGHLLKEYGLPCGSLVFLQVGSLVAVSACTAQTPSLCCPGFVPPSTTPSSPPPGSPPPLKSPPPSSVAKPNPPLNLSLPLPSQPASPIISSPAVQNFLPPLAVSSPLHPPPPASISKKQPPTPNHRSPPSKSSGSSPAVQQYNITIQVTAPATFYGSFILGTEISAYLCPTLLTAIYTALDQQSLPEYSLASTCVVWMPGRDSGLAYQFLLSISERSLNFFQKVLKSNKGLSSFLTTSNILCSSSIKVFGFDSMSFLLVTLDQSNSPLLDNNYPQATCMRPVKVLGYQK
ncbi:hypothetical protein CEUSTIGMA_g9539.t1 [Chlamydomonas eustigma]|uniref:Pherophorin domain-containing protein n=1 Tax=Chlamydomonas eustigma TaxID=1157962 RepID=A0A250XGA9_9CHLO|nr:hypothetical protein CEUSTIGMA_g9539.t1 [Chlamydomonas eustigma]|eukprot:GAX82111.1 hypothetical protein CEUSTIGMA_g9539.t1 [Chlamydomonas eustigma]